MNKEMLAIASEEARMKISDQLSAVDTTDQKIGILIGLVGVMLAILVSQNATSSTSMLFYLLGLMFLIVSFLILVFGHRSINLKTGLNIKGYTELIKKYSPDDNVIAFRRYQLKYFEDSVTSNNNLIGKKNTYLAYGTISLFMGLMCSMVYCIL